MLTTLARETGVIDLEDSVYRNRRPRITVGADISDPRLSETSGFHECREILIGEIYRMHYNCGVGLLNGDAPWVGMEWLHEIKASEVTLLNATVGVMGALLAPSDMGCIEPMVDQRTALATSILVCGGYPAWTTHPAIASLHLYQLRLAYFLMKGGLTNDFINILPLERSDLEEAIRSRDFDQLMNTLRAIKTGVQSLHLDWERMNHDDRYWQIVHAIIDANQAGEYSKLFLADAQGDWSHYNGTLSWWFDGGAAMLGHWDEWDEPLEEEYWDDESDEDEDDY